MESKKGTIINYKETPRYKQFVIRIKLNNISDVKVMNKIIELSEEKYNDNIQRTILNCLKKFFNLQEK
ncbi:MAG: hypothetical protein ACRC0A_07675 [Chitinophagaceae bacterium]